MAVFPHPTLPLYKQLYKKLQDCRTAVTQEKEEEEVAGEGGEGGGEGGEGGEGGGEEEEEEEACPTLVFAQLFKNTTVKPVDNVCENINNAPSVLSFSPRAKAMNHS